MFRLEQIKQKLIKVLRACGQGFPKEKGKFANRMTIGKLFTSIIHRVGNFSNAQAVFLMNHTTADDVTLQIAFALK